MINAEVKKLDVTATVSAAYLRTLADVRGYALLAAPMIVFLLFGNYIQFSYMVEIAKRGDLASFEFDPRLVLIQLVSIPLYVMLFTNIVRRTLLGSNGPRNPLGLGWGRREFRVLGRGLIFVGAPLLVYALAFTLILIATANGRPPVWIFVFLPFLPLASMIAVVFLYCRLCVYPITPCLDADLDFRNAFQSTRGNVLPIFGSHLLTALPFLIGSSAVSIVLGSQNVLLLEDKSLVLWIPVLTVVQMGIAIVVTVLLALIYEQLVLIPATEGGRDSPSGARLTGVGGY